MRIAYLDCFAGIAGDMFLGALLDAGVPPSVLEGSVAALNLNAALTIETVDRSGISSTKVNVLEGGELAEAKLHAHGHEHRHKHDHESAQHSPLPERQDLHTHSHTHDGHTHEHQHHEHRHAPQAHDHAPSHVHGRSLAEIRNLINAAPLAQPVKEFAIRAFDLLGHSEARIHNVPVDHIHFHEVGGVDAIVDIVAASAGVHHLGISHWFASPVNVGGGMVECAHGTFPVPAPATADLLREVPTYSAHVQKELVTPTGAALLRTLQPTFGPQPTMQVEQIGYGAGTRNPKGFPNVLRLSLGEQDSVVPTSPRQFPTTEPQGEAQGEAEGEVVTVLETALDDASPQLLAYVAERALAEGALDVMLTPVVMKKGRPGTLVTLLCNPAESRTFEQFLLRETPTLGLRIRQDRRVCLQRRHATVQTPYGNIRVKIGSTDGQELNVAPEFEDCRAAAAQHSVPLKLVQQAALAAYRR